MPLLQPSIGDRDKQRLVRLGPHARGHHHVDQICHIPRAVAQPAHLGMPRTILGTVAPMLARVAIALRRAGALTIAGVWTAWRNIIVPRKAGGGTPSVCFGTVRLSVHARIIPPVRGVFDKARRRAEGPRENLGSTSVFRQNHRAYRTSVQNADFLFDFRNSNPARRRKALLRRNKVRPSRATRTR
jgi:hypothetical protein